MKISIATPMYGGVCHGIFLKGIMSLINELKSRGHEVLYHDLYNESLITRARNTLTEIFLRTDSDVLVFIDADQGFDHIGVCKMIEEDVDIIGAPVPMKGINWEKVGNAARDGKTDLQKYTAIYNVNISQEQKEVLLKNPLDRVEVIYVGTGLIAIKRNVFDSLKTNVGQYRTDQNGLGGIQKGDGIYDFWNTGIDAASERLLSEDYQFCQLWKNTGGKIYLAPYVKVTHAGTYWFE
jgi:hypothetical protein